MSRETELSNRRMLRARDEMDRSFAEPLDIPTLARIAVSSESHFVRTCPPVMDPTTAEQVRALVRKGAMRDGLCITTPEAHAAADERTERPDGIDFGIRDPSGNAIGIGLLNSTVSGATTTSSSS